MNARASSQTAGTPVKPARLPSHTPTSPLTEKGEMQLPQITQIIDLLQSRSHWYWYWFAVVTSHFNPIQERPSRDCGLMGKTHSQTPHFTQTNHICTFCILSPSGTIIALLSQEYCGTGQPLPSIIQVDLDLQRALLRLLQAFSEELRVLPGCVAITTAELRHQQQLRGASHDGEGLRGPI